MNGQKEFAMDTSTLIEKLEHDVRYLLWKAKIHNLPSVEIERRYHQIEKNYLSLSEDPQTDLVKYKLADWSDEVKRVTDFS